jgi:four helix bundle protein
MSTSKPHNLCDRTFLFAKDIVALCVPLSQNAGARRQIAGQLLRSGTSVGANAEEAKAALGRKDFSYRNSVVLREARETHFWLRLLEASALARPADVRPLIQEANELVAIYVAVVKRSRR